MRLEPRPTPEVLVAVSDKHKHRPRASMFFFIKLKSQPHRPHCLRTFLRTHSPQTQTMDYPAGSFIKYFPEDV